MKPIKFFMAFACVSGQLLISPVWAQASSAVSSTPATFSDGCPAPGALQYVCLRPRSSTVKPAKAPACNASTTNGRADPSQCKDAPYADGNSANSAELLNQIFINDANDTTIASHTPRQAQLVALALVEALQAAWATLPPYDTLSEQSPRRTGPRSSSIATHNSQMLAAAMVGNALVLNPCLDLDQRRATSPAGEPVIGTTSSVCDPAIQSVNGIGIAKLNMAFYQKKAGVPTQYVFPYYQDFYNKINSWTNNLYRAGSFLDSVLYLGQLFTGLHSARPLYFLKMPLNSIEMPFVHASPFSKALPATAVALDDSNIDYAVDAFAAFQAVGVGSCLGSSSTPADASKDPCSHQCRVNAANRVLGWVQQMQPDAIPCVEPARPRSITTPAPGMML